MKISKNHADVRGEKNPMFGKTHTEEVRNKLRLKYTGFKHSQEFKQRHSEITKGINNPNSKLTDEIVREIRNEYNNGIKMKDLAKKYDVNAPCIWKIIHNYTWKHLIK
jgi:Mor family transcriptional regulator